MRHIYIMSGIPGCGKSTYTHIHARPGDILLSRDNYRHSLREKFNKPNDYFPCSERKEWELWTGLIIETMNKWPQSTIYIDQTTLTQKALNKLLRALKPYITKDDFISVICVHTALDVCLKRNTYREGFARVPSDVIRSMHARQMEDSITIEETWRLLGSNDVEVIHTTSMEE